MTQKFIVGDVVMYDNKIMIIKEPRDGIHFDLSCPKDGLTYCYVSINEIKGIPLTPEILEKSGWKHKKEFGEYWFIPRNEDYELLALDKVGEEWTIYIEENCSNFEYIKFVHQLQHLLFGLNINHEMKV